MALTFLPFFLAMDMAACDLRADILELGDDDAGDGVKTASLVICVDGA